MSFFFLRFMELWTQRVLCKVNVTPYFARDPLCSYFHEPQKNEIYFLTQTFKMMLIGSARPCDPILISLAGNWLTPVAVLVKFLYYLSDHCLVNMFETERGIAFFWTIFLSGYATGMTCKSSDKWRLSLFRRRTAASLFWPYEQACLQRPIHRTSLQWFCHPASGSSSALNFRGAAGICRI